MSRWIGIFVLETCDLKHRVRRDRERIERKTVRKQGYGGKSNWGEGKPRVLGLPTSMFHVQILLSSASIHVHIKHSWAGGRLRWMRKFPFFGAILRVWFFVTTRSYCTQRSPALFPEDLE